MDNCNSILEALREQLASSFSISPSGAGCLVETPFHYPDRRVMTIHVSSTLDGALELSDDGYAHSYAFMSGVGPAAVKNRVRELMERYGVKADRGEVIATTTSAELLSGMLAVIEASQGIADTVEAKRPRTANTRLDRQIARALVLSNRTYDRRGRVPIGDREIDVDYNVHPTDEYEQLSLFSIGKSVDMRRAESIAWRIQQLREAPRSPQHSGTVVVIADEAGMFSEGDRWLRARDTIARAGAPIIPISEARRLERVLTG